MSLYPDISSIEERVTHEYAARLDGWDGMIRRRQEIRALVANQWGKVWPNELGHDEAPMVANMFRTTIEDLGRLFAEQMPTERVYSRGGETPEAVKEADEIAQKRENVVMGYTSGSGINDILEYVGMDMVGAGYAAIKTWPDYSMKRAQRTPVFRLLDVMTTLPELTWKPHKPTDNVIVNYVESIEHLQATAPEAAARMLERVGASRLEALKNSDYDLSALFGTSAKPLNTDEQPTLEMVDWYSSEFVARVACYRDPQARQEYGVLLQYLPHNTGICPVQLAPRPTWASEPLGQLDDAKGIQLTKNRYFTILLDYFIRMVYGGKLVFNVKNPTEIGPDTRYFALGPDAYMKPVTPEIPSFQATNILGALDQEARTTAIAPASREGEVDLNKASAAFLTKAQGQYNSVVRSLDRNYAVAKRRSNEAAIALDERLCNWPKTLTGAARGKHFAVSYTPRELFKGDGANFVTYGTSSGLDAPTHNVINLQKAQTGHMSLETFLEQDPSIEDVSAELARMAGDQVRSAGLAMLLEPTLPAADRVRAIRAFSVRKSVEDVIEELAKQAPAPGMALSPTGTPVVPSGPSGAPGVEAPQQPTALPPAALLRSVGPRRPAPAGR